MSDSSNSPNCPFCSLSSDRLLKENGLACAISDSYPVTKGHALVIPKRHTENYFSLTKEELLACDELIKAVRNRIETEDLTVKGFNVGVNAGVAAGQTVFHCHIHLIPRRIGDVDEPRGGIRNLIPGKGNY